MIKSAMREREGVCLCVRAPQNVHLMYSQGLRVNTQCLHNFRKILALQRRDEISNTMLQISPARHKTRVRVISCSKEPLASLRVRRGTHHQSLLDSALLIYLVLFLPMAHHWDPPVSRPERESAAGYYSSRGVDFDATGKKIKNKK